MCRGTDLARAVARAAPVAADVLTTPAHAHVPVEVTTTDVPTAGPDLQRMVLRPEPATLQVLTQQTVVAVLHRQETSKTALKLRNR